MQQRKKHYTNIFFFTRLKKNESEIFEICAINFEPIKISIDPLSTAKWLSELQFCERYSCSWQKMARNGHKTDI